MQYSIIAIAAAAQLAMVSATPSFWGNNRLMPRDNGCAAEGVVNGECGRLYVNDGCGDGDDFLQIQPNCDKSCKTVTQGFKSIKASGDGTHGTACYPFTGQNCEEDTAAGNTGLATIAGQEKCESSSDSKNNDKGTFYSYFCTFNC